MKPYRNRKLLNLAKEAPHCMSCGKLNDGTIVPAHRNEYKGMGMKATDAWVAFCCGDCHAEIDNGKELTREERQTKWLRAYANTMRWLIESGLLIIKV